MAIELISLGILFLCAIIGGIIATKFKQPAVFGLLLIGAIIGPNLLNLVEDTEMIGRMADLGAILTLFIIGLEFDISKVMKLGLRSILIGLLKFSIVLFLGYETTLLLGFSTKVALFVGVILSFSSTVVVVKVLEQKEMFRRNEVPLLVAVLIIEDILAVFVLTFFSSVKDSNISLMTTFEHVIFSIGILLFAYFLMMKILRHGVNIILKNNSDESTLTFLSLAIGALFSYFASSLGLTPPAGAFLAGSLIASLPNAKDYGRAIYPYALIFTSIFFISMGTFVDFKAIESNFIFISVLLIVVLVSRFIAIGFLTFLLANFKKEQPFFSSIAMMSVGEFSLLVAKESEKFALGVDLVTITATIIFISAVLMSIGINYSENIYTSLNPKVPLRAKIKLERLSNYMRKFFDQIEIENFFTKKLRTESKIVFVLTILMILTFLILRKISLIIRFNYPYFVLYAFYIVSSLIILIISNFIYRRLKVLHYTLSVILTNVDNSRNLKKCNKILNNLLFALFFFFTAMLSPFAMFTLNLSIWANFITFIFIIFGFYYTRNLVALIDDHGISQAQSYIVKSSIAKL
ncbi:cation:proton antiporter [Candidatus Woesearchaeota archaeon]|nr:cation:proton antiporter [Candidatus Woesearchaeota archaeon]